MAGDYDWPYGPPWIYQINMPVISICLLEVTREIKEISTEQLAGHGAHGPRDAHLCDLMRCPSVGVEPMEPSRGVWKMCGIQFKGNRRQRLVIL